MLQITAALVLACTTPTGGYATGTPISGDAAGASSGMSQRGHTGRTPAQRRAQPRTPAPLHHGLTSVTTLGMGTGGYRDVTHDAYRPVSWVLNAPSWFHQAGFASPSAPGNNIDTIQKADQYATFVTGWILETLHLVNHVDGQPIAIDLEDQGVDVALSFADWRLAVEEVGGNYGAWVHGNPYQTGTYGSDWATCEAFVIHALKTVTSGVRAAYPNSPIGWYNGGPHIFSPWCGKLGLGATSSNYKVAEKYFELTAARDPRMNSWKWVDPNGIGADFGFVTFYPNLTHLQQEPHLSHFTYGTRESLQNWNYLVMKHGGPSTAGWSGLWDRMFIGQPLQWVVSNAIDYSTTEHPLETLAHSGVCGTIDCGAETSTDPLSGWKQSILLHSDYLTPLVSKGPHPGPVMNPNQPLKVLLDYCAWQWTESCSDMPEGYQTVAHRPSAADTATGTTLPDRWHQMKFGIWDAFFTGPHDFDSTVVLCGPRDEVAHGLFEGTNLASHLMTLLARMFADPELYSHVATLGPDLGGKHLAFALDQRAAHYTDMVIRRRGIFLGGAAGGRPDTCPSDLNGDGTVDATDLGLLLGNFGTCAFGCIADLDGDQDVDAGDLGLTLGRWGACP